MTDVAARTYGLQQGTPDLKSIGPITFGPDGKPHVAALVVDRGCIVDDDL